VRRPMYVHTHMYVLICTYNGSGIWILCESKTNFYGKYVGFQVLQIVECGKFPVFCNFPESYSTKQRNFLCCIRVKCYPLSSHSTVSDFSLLKRLTGCALCVPRRLSISLDMRFPNTFQNSNRFNFIVVWSHFFLLNILIKISIWISFL